MKTANSFNPNWASPPGKTIEEILHSKGLSIEKFANKMNRTSEYVQELLNGYIEITGELARQLSIILGASSDFWLNRESQYREIITRLKAKEEEEWIRSLPYRDMIKLGWISEVQNKIEECLNFFAVPDIETWKAKYGSISNKVAFRNSLSFTSESVSIAAWLRQGEIQSEFIECKPWNEEKFEKILPQIKALTRKKNPQDFIPELIRLCAECGVAVVIVRTPSGCRASGATRFIDPNKAIIQLSFRYLSDDQFWFTFFHEAGHLILHNHKSIFLETAEQITNTEEEEANLFAGEVLIPHELQPELANIRGNKRNIIQFAMSAGVSAGIVIGQLQHKGFIDKGYLNGYKRRYDWNDILNNQPPK